MKNKSYELYRFIGIVGSLLLVASIVTQTLWASCLAGVMMWVTMVLDYYIIKEFHAGLHAKDDILDDYMNQVTDLKHELAEVYSNYDKLEDTASDILDELVKETHMDNDKRVEYYKKIYLDHSDDDGVVPDL